MIDSQKKLACITLDLEAFGWHDFPAECLILKDADLVSDLKTIFDKHDIRPTIFAVGKVIENAPDAINLYSTLDADFELHSYSHNVDDTDSDEELERAVFAYKHFFGESPRGYRAPWGKISTEGILRLARMGFNYDSSVFPTFRPGVFNFLHAPIRPFRWKAAGLVEIPASVVPVLRLAIGMSYLKFLGLSVYRGLFSLFGMPDPLVFIAHPQDFRLDDESLDRSDLPGWVKFYHAKNVSGSLDIFDHFLDFIKRRGYSFVTMGEIYDQFMDK